MSFLSVRGLARRAVYVPVGADPRGPDGGAPRSRRRDVRDRHPGPAPRLPHRAAAARRRLHRSADLVPRRSAPLLGAVPRGHPRPALARPRHPVRGVLALRLRRRRGGAAGRARHRARRSWPASRWARSSRSGCGASTPTGSPGWCCAPPPTGSGGRRPSGCSTRAWSSRWSAPAASPGRVRRCARRATAAEALDLTPADIHDWALREFRSTSPWAVGQAVAALGRHHSRPWLSAGSTSRPRSWSPTTDRVIPPERQLDLARRIPGATIHDIDAGHASCVLESEVFVPAFLEAVATVNARRRDFSR